MNELKESYYDTHSSLLFGKDKHTDDSFYAHVLSYLKMSIGKDEALPCGVKFEKGQYHLTIHPGFLNLTPKERRFRLKEQALHVLFKHIPRQGIKEVDIWNQACDLSIHQLLNKSRSKEDSDDKALFPENFKFDEKLTAELYYTLLNEKKQENNSDESPSRGDDHSSWSDSSKGDGEYSKEEKEQLADELAEMIMDSALSKSIGNISSDLNETLNLYKTGRKINWKKYLKASLNKKSKGRKSTWKKINRRFPDDLTIKGYTRKFGNNVTIAVDVSGSMSNKEVIDGLSEVINMCRQMNCKTNLIQIDTEIKSVEKLSANSITFNRKGMGGTYMWDGIKYIMDSPTLNPDTVILITDGMIEGSWEQTPPFKVIFLIVGKGNTLNLDTSNIDCKVFSISE
jgi:predicted metal-dependent peptidase